MFTDEEDIGLACGGRVDEAKLFSTNVCAQNVTNTAGHLWPSVYSSRGDLDVRSCEL